LRMLLILCIRKENTVKKDAQTINLI